MEGLLEDPRNEEGGRVESWEPEELPKGPDLVRPDQESPTRVARGRPGTGRDEGVGRLTTVKTGSETLMRPTTGARPITSRRSGTRLSQTDATGDTRAETDESALEASESTRADTRPERYATRSTWDGPDDTQQTCVGA